MSLVTEMVEWWPPEEAAWRARAACRAACETGVAVQDDWFPERGDVDSIARARAICARCPVQAECLAYGCEHSPGIGITRSLTPGSVAEQLRVDRDN
jgi:hypothetical protein